ncbi:BRCA1-associated RING domain protein 1-like [Ostrinia nubilalis]|uniref:BRCA1-associated RING domain protein 1-like n=1 Tax=Ostrinia nubilalis TaxID=29057 RepID=UPI003082463A
MSATDLSNFLKALDAVKQDYTCGVCSNLCEDPVTLSKCFHLICGKHFESLKTCPTCNVSLEGCTIFADDRLGPCVQSAKELDKIFDNFRPKDAQPTKAENTTKAPKKRARHNTNDKSSDEKAQKETKALSDKSNKVQKPNMNTSLLSNASSKANKAIEKRNNKGETMLHISCRLGKIDKITELLNQGANTNTKDNAGWTPLHEVVQNGRLDLVKLLLQYNTLINVPGQSNETPLHEAVRYNHIDIAVELVKNGADLNARNCKGETPLQLAQGAMKEKLIMASEDIIQTQTVNITLISNLHSELDFDDIRVYCNSQFRTVQNKLKLLTKHHTNLHVETKFTKKVTHLIVDAEEDRVCTSSLDVLQGIAYGVWILTTDWITKSTEDKLEPFDRYEVTGVGSKSYNGPKNARYNKYKQFPGLFDGCHFYLHNFNTKYEITKNIVVTKALLTKLIMDAGGIVLRRVPNPESIPDSEKLVPYHANKDGKLVNCSHYIIFKDMYEPMYNMQHLKALPIGWLIECVEKYELCEPIVYNYA